MSEFVLFFNMNKLSALFHMFTSVLFVKCVFVSIVKTGTSRFWFASKEKHLTSFSLANRLNECSDVFSKGFVIGT